MSGRVLPVSTSDNYDDEPSLHKQDSSLSLSLLGTLCATVMREMKEMRESCSLKNFKRLLVWFLDTANFKLSISFDDLMMMLTFFVLFADDIRLLTAPKAVDGGFEIVNSICLFFFIFELFLSTFAKTEIKSVSPFRMEGYCFSFFFWLDTIAILSMLPDINWIAEGIGLGGIAETVANTNNSFSKAGRVVRTVRLARLVRIYKIQSERKRLVRIEEEQMELVRQGVLTYEDVQKSKQINQERNSKVGAELSDTITRRVIIIVLLMLCLIPILNYTPADHTQHYSTRLLHQYNKDGTNESQILILNDFLKYYRSHQGEPYCIRLEMSPYQREYIIDDIHYQHILRSTAITKEVFQGKHNGKVYKTVAWFNNEYAVKEVALNGILLTIFVSFVMLIGTVTFTGDVENLVLKPIQRMMNMVEQVAKDPLSPLFFDHSDGTGEYETLLLEGTIEKITSLLRVGFGEAGAGIISANLNLEDNTSVINPLIPGVRVYAIFGFCDIHHFEDVNEKLGKDIMTFVNTIALVVHSSVHEWRGQSNKNLGQAFLVVWRIGDEQTLSELLNANPHRATTARASITSSGSIFKKKSHPIDLRRVPGVDVLADSALIAYLKIIAEINRSAAVLKYREEPRLTMNGTQEFHIRMGFGLHAGWAIEGAVGSLQKVDATYLSPHVNMAARLETSSKQYGVPLLMSQNFQELMSEDVKSYCRRLDVITVKGSEVPIGIYTYDCQQDQYFAPKREVDEINGRFKSKKSLKDHHVFLTAAHETCEVFEQDYDIVTLRNHYKPEFRQIFNEGLELYLSGDWPTARGFFEKASQMMSNIPHFEKGDGPSNTLLNYMENYGWQAPSSWKGFRPLTSK